jgi:copper chaperone CopZ
MSRLFAGLAVCIVLVGCGQQPAKMPKATADAVKPVAFNVAGAPTVEFNAPDMMCPEGCGEKVKEILSEQPGAKEVFVDFDAKVAKVAVSDDGKFDKDAAVAALVDHGFQNSSVKSAPVAADAAPASSADGAPKDGHAG